MNHTEQMVHAINGFLRMLGEAPLDIPEPAPGSEEIMLLKAARAEYTRRLLQKVPKYARLRSEAEIPDMFLQALLRREHELQKRTR